MLHQCTQGTQQTRALAERLLSRGHPQ